MMQVGVKGAQLIGYVCLWMPSILHASEHFSQHGIWVGMVGLKKVGSGKNGRGATEEKEVC